MGKRIALVLICLATALPCGGCFTVGLKATDYASREASKAPGPLGAAGRTTQSGVQGIERAQHQAWEKAKSVVR